MHRRIPHWATVVTPLVHVSLPLSNGPFAVDAAPSPSSASQLPFRRRSCAVLSCVHAPSSRPCPYYIVPCPVHAPLSSSPPNYYRARSMRYRPLPQRSTAVAASLIQPPSPSDIPSFLLSSGFHHSFPRACSAFQANNHHPLHRARSLVSFPSKQPSSVPPSKILGPFRPLTLLRPRAVVPFPRWGSIVPSPVHAASSPSSVHVP